jgi:hypothetical protein
MWKDRLPLSDDVKGSWNLFQSANYIPILYGLNWFDNDKIKKQYNEYYRDTVESDIINQLNLEPPAFFVGHKKFIKEIVNGRRS